MTFPTNNDRDKAHAVFTAKPLRLCQYSCYHSTTNHTIPASLYRPPIGQVVVRAKHSDHCPHAGALRDSCRTSRT
jgi:hypothetical protein